MRVSPDEKEEWQRWQAIADKEGAPTFVDWVYTRIRQSLAPKPRQTTMSLSDVFKRGQRLGLMVGRLDAIFEQEREDEIDLGWLTGWVVKNPDLVPDVLQMLTLRPYGERFHAWWTEAIGPTVPTARNLSGSR